MEILARRSIETSGSVISIEIVVTGNGPALKSEGVAMMPLSISDTHRLLSRFSRASGEDEGLTEYGERLLAILGEII